MRTYTFSGAMSGQTIVSAGSEAEARHLAMVDRWGPPTGMYDRNLPYRSVDKKGRVVDTRTGLDYEPSPYEGIGLSLLSIR